MPNLSVPVTVRVRRSGRRALRKSRTAVSRNAYGFIHPHPAAPAAQPHATRRVAQTKMSASPGSPIPARREGAGGGGCGAARGARAPRPWATSGAGRQPTTIAHTFILELGRYNRRNGSQTGGAVRRGVGEPVTLSSGVGRSGRHVVLERDVLVAVKVVESSSRAASRARRRRRSSRSRGGLHTHDSQTAAGKVPSDGSDVSHTQGERVNFACVCMSFLFSEGAVWSTLVARPPTQVPYEYCMVCRGV